MLKILKKNPQHQTEDNGIHVNDYSRKGIKCTIQVGNDSPFNIFFNKPDKAVGHFVLLFDVRMTGSIFIGYEVSVYFNVI